MKFVVTLVSENTKTFDYKIMFFLNKEFDLIGVSSSANEEGKFLFATVTKEISDQVDVEIERRKLFEEMNQYLYQQR